MKKRIIVTGIFFVIATVIIILIWPQGKGIIKNLLRLVLVVGDIGVTGFLFVALPNID